MSNPENFISIIVPVYNSELFLERCIISILKQTYTHYEVILIDDGSTDNSPQLCDELANKYTNFHSYHLKNTSVGVSDARNAGVTHAKGKYLTFIDSDDFVHPTFIEVLINAVGNTIPMSMCSYQKFNPNEKCPDPLDDKELVTLIDDSEAMSMLVDDQSLSASWGKLFNATLFHNVKYPSGTYNEDMLITPVLLRNAKTIAFTPQALYYYCQDAPSLVRATFNYHKLDMIIATKFWKEQALRYYPGLVNRTRAHYYATLILTCQYIANRKDAYGQKRYREIIEEIKINYTYIKNSEDISKNNKFKLLLIKVGLFWLFFKSIEFFNIRKYDVGF